MPVLLDVLERALQAAVKQHFDDLHQAGVCVSYDKISDLSKRVVANQLRSRVEAALEAVL